MEIKCNFFDYFVPKLFEKIIICSKLEILVKIKIPPIKSLYLTETQWLNGTFPFSFPDYPFILFKKVEGGI